MHWFVAWWTLLWLVVGSAVASEEPGPSAPDAPAQMTQDPTPPRSGAYRIGAGDTLKVVVYEEPDLSGDVVVSEACNVSLALVGRIAVCGLTPADLEQRIAEAYDADYLVSPTVAVKVTEYRSQRVDVLGEVEETGPIYLEGPTTLVEAISMAGGPAAENVVSVDVVGADGTRTTYDLTRITASAETVMVSAGDKIVLKPGEVVYLEGEIKRPGTVVLAEDMTVTQALATAGGPEVYANLRRVLIRRADGSSQRVNILRVHKGVEEDVVLQPDDHVIVPRGAF